jgi:hypothetical protein
MVRHWFRINDTKRNARNSLPILILEFTASSDRKKEADEATQNLGHSLWLSHSKWLLWALMEASSYWLMLQDAHPGCHHNLPSTCASHHAPLRARSCPITPCAYGSTRCGPSCCSYPLKPRTRLTNDGSRSKKEQRLKFSHVPPANRTDENCFGGNANVHSPASNTRDDFALRRSPFFPFRSANFSFSVFSHDNFYMMRPLKFKIPSKRRETESFVRSLFWLTYLCPCSRRHRQRDFRLLFVDKNL